MAVVSVGCIVLGGRLRTRQQHNESEQALLQLPPIEWRSTDAYTRITVPISSGIDLGVRIIIFHRCINLASVPIDLEE
jgi:hypothetical protein